jgi:hypothetical protein
MDSVNCPALLTTFDFTALQQYLPKPMAQRIPHLTQLQALFLCCQEDEDTAKTLLKLTTLTNLKHISIAIQFFTIDSIEELFARLSNLQSCKVYYADMPRHAMIFNSWTNLTSLTLADSTKYLEGLTALQNLEELIIERSLVKPSQFEYLNYLPKLTYLECYYNGRMLEPSFKFMSAMTSLKAFKMRENTDNWGAYYSTKAFEWLSNSMTNLTKLEWLWNFTGPFPDNFTNLQKLKVFEMPEWDMMNKDLDKLIRLTQLVQLSISTAKAKTADKLLVLTNLQNLALYGKANFTKEFVASALTKLTYLHFMASNS